MPQLSATRRQSLQHNREKAQLERLGSRESAAIGRSIRLQVIRAWRRGDNWRNELQKQIKRLTPTMTDGMMASWLYGRRRVQLRASRHMGRRIKLSTAYDSALRFLSKQLELTPGQLDEMREKFAPNAEQVILQAETHLEKKILKATQQAAAQGLHVRGGVELIKQAFDSSGVTPENSYLLEGIYRTQTALAYGAGRWTTLREPVIDDILWGFEYDTVGDDLVRPNHYAMHGIRLPKDHPFWLSNWTPNGHACRCEALEIFKGDHAARNDRIREPKVTLVDGTPIQPTADDGFAFNPGTYFGGVRQTFDSVPMDRAIATKSVGQVATAVNESIKAATTIHNVPDDFPTTSVRVLPPDHPDLEGNLGRYAVGEENGEDFYRILISSDTPTPHLTALEEIGHALDYRAWGPPWNELNSRLPGTNPHIDRVIELAGQTRKHVQLRAKLSRADPTSKQHEHLVYRLSREETFARAYVQFVARKSKGKIYNELRANRQRGRYWDDDDFEPIMTAMEELMENTPWTKRS